MMVSCEPLRTTSADPERYGVITLVHLPVRMSAPGHRGLGRIAVERAVVQAFRLEEHHRIVVLDRGDQQALGIAGIRGHDDLESAHMRENALRTLRMRLTAADAAAARRAYGHRGEEFAGAAIAKARQFAHDLIERRINIIGELNFRDRPQPVHAHADGGGDDAALGDRRIEHAVFAVLALQTFGRAEHAAEIADVLAHQHDRGIAPEHDVHGGIQRLNHVHAGHGRSMRIKARCRCKCCGISLNTSSNIRSASSLGPSFIVP